MSSAGRCLSRIFLIKRLELALVSFGFVRCIIADRLGGLVVIGLFLKQWDTHRCSQIFDSFTRDFFGVHLTKGRSFFTRMRDYFRCWLIDGCYDVGLLECTLKDVLGSQQRMFDTHESGISGCKVAVTATTISDASAFVFSNYNGDGTRERNCGKHILPKNLCLR